VKGFCNNGIFYRLFCQFSNDIFDMLMPIIVTRSRTKSTVYYTLANPQFSWTWCRLCYISRWAVIVNGIVLCLKSTQCSPKASRSHRV